VAGTRTVADLKEARQAVMDGADAVSFGEAQDLDGKAKLRFWDGRCGDCLLTVLKGPCPHPELGAWTNPISDFGGNASQVIGHQALKGYRLGPPEGYSQIKVYVRDRDKNITRDGRGNPITRYHDGSKAISIKDVADSGSHLSIVAPKTQVERLDAPRGRRRRRGKRGNRRS